MPGAITIVLALGSQEKAIQTFVLAHGADPIQPAGKHFVDVTLVANVKDELVLWRSENSMKRDRQLDDAEIGPEMASGLGKDLDQLVTHLLRELREAFLWQSFHIGRRMDSLEQTNVLLG